MTIFLWGAIMLVLLVLLASGFEIVLILFLLALRIKSSIGGWLYSLGLIERQTFIRWKLNSMMGGRG